MTSTSSKSWRLPAGTETLQVQLARGASRPGPSHLVGLYLDQWIGDPVSRRALLEMFEASSGWSWPAWMTGGRTRLRAQLRASLAQAFDTGALVAIPAGAHGKTKPGAPTVRSWTLRPARGQEFQFKRREQLATDDRIQDPEKMLAFLDDWLTLPATRGVVAQMYADLQNLPPGKAPTTFNPATLKLIRTTLTKAIREKTIVAVQQQGGTTVDPEVEPPVKTPPPPPKPETKEKTWFQCQVLDEEGIPMSGERYTLVDSDGGRHEGKLDDEGKVYIPPILDPGDCTIRLPDIHLNPRKRK